jgi:predicted NBD/HSP70 family sugar kinase
MLLNEGGKSRLQLAKSLHLTGASISQLVKQLIEQGLVLESGSMQRNATGRREVLLNINNEKFGAIGVNIEADKTHISLCNYDKVVEERIFETDILIANQETDNLIAEIDNIYKKHKDSMEIMGLGVGITGQVDEKNGIAIDSHGILPANYPLYATLKKQIAVDIRIINNVKAQARALISDREDNFMYVKHSPGIGCAIVVGGKVVDGFNSIAGELGHTVVEKNGDICSCGKRGCLETVVSEKAIVKKLFKKTGQGIKIEEIYKKYGYSDVITSIFDECIELLALAIGNAATINDPKKIMLTGGLFFQSNLLNAFNKKMDELGFGRLYKIINVDNDKRIKAYAGARHILLEKLFEV